MLLARHGETVWNRAGRRQGQSDSPLTDRGVEQAHRHAAMLRGYGVDRVFTSPLGRAMRTAEIIAAGLAANLVVVADLAEIDHGEFAGLTTAEIEAAHRVEWLRRTQDKYEWRFPGGESYADGYRRAVRALDLIDRHAAARPLIISHEMINRMVSGRLLDLSTADALALRHPHDVIYEVDPRSRTRIALSPMPARPPRSG